MRMPSFLAVSLLGNLILAAAFMVVRPGSGVGPATQATATSKPAMGQAGPAWPAGEAVRAPLVPWSAIASADYRQYIANLRKARCPEWLVRDMLVAALDDFYDLKTLPDTAGLAPWQGVDGHYELPRGAAAKRQALRQHKRALVKALLGYEWENYAEEIWSQDLPTSLRLGFLPDDKATDVIALQDQYTEAAQHVREDANFILIDDDRVRLQSLYTGFEDDLARRLGIAELDEWQLRSQQSFLLANDIHFNGVAINPEELRALVRLSRNFKDMALNEFIFERPLSEQQQEARTAAFEAQVEGLLGERRFADYRRAQDGNFREILAYSQQNYLPQATAVAVYESRQKAMEQAAEIRMDGSLSAEERSIALTVLSAATGNAVAAELGGNYQNYRRGSGQWLAALTQSPETQTETEAR